jgi:hypothetical protein
MTYDPTIGFTFKPNPSNPEYLLGSYICIAGGNERDFLVINVQKQPGEFIRLN